MNKKCVGYDDVPTMYKRRKKKLTPAERRKRALIKWYNKHIGTIVVITIIVSIIAISAFITNKIVTYKQNNTMLDFGRTRHCTTYTVKYGDTLWDIAKDMCSINPEYPDVRVYISEVQEINGIYDIKAGDIISLPYYEFSNNDEHTVNIIEKYNIGD